MNIYYSTNAGAGSFFWIRWTMSSTDERLTISTRSIILLSRFLREVTGLNTWTRLYQ